MKDLMYFLFHRGWIIEEYKNDSTKLIATYNKDKFIYLEIEKELGVANYYKTKWIVNEEVYTISSNGNEKFIFKELLKLGFK
ncbi:hypothetical protein IC213_18535 [Clostridioides sp. ES-S-0049-02]|uniref:hypothetical protein n=1 Tax=Clostridioides sp. ES-S-0049-02 TaxID=2770778 RepID=UPI001D11EF28|nr:hypothetical protein [Clostridioides sp. ES-S-0049-02]